MLTTLCPSRHIRLGTTPIPSASITLGEEGQLGSDGALYAALPDGTTVDVTPTVSGNSFCTFGVSAVGNTSLPLLPTE